MEDRSVESYSAQPAWIQAEPASQPTAANGCLQSGLLIFMTLWILVATGLSQLVSWSIEQQIFEGSFKIPDVRWLVDLIYGLAILVPALILWLVLRRPSLRVTNARFYAAFGLAGLFALLQAPARLAGVTAALLTDVILIVGTGAFWLALALYQRRSAPHRANWTGLSAALLMAGALSIPWVLWGALGSVWDTLLNLIAALLFGLAGAAVLRLVFRRDTQQPYRRRDLLLEGMAAALALLVMATGMGVNGNQGLLSECVPVLGWALVGLFTRSTVENGRAVENTPVLALLIGLAAFWPMAFIDPDELAAVITLGQGELIQWASLAGALGLSIAVVSSRLLFVLYPRVRDAGRRFSVVPAAVVWLAALGLYLGLGQPGLFGERLFVVLKDQADLSAAAQIKDYPQRRAAVYQALVEKADTSQAGIRQTLDRFRIPYQPYYLENAIEVQGGPLVRWWLQSRPEVDRVLDNPMLRPLPEPVPQSKGDASAPTDTPWNLKMIGADRVWTDFGVNGKGIIVGQSDSGADGRHPELAPSYRGQGGQNDYNWFDPWYHSSAPTDIGGHGTHTLGTVVGKQVGIAPGAQWIGCVNLARNLGNPALYLDCMQFMLAPFPQNGDPLHDGKPEMGAMVLNNSWGCPPVEGCDPNALLPGVKALRAAGIFVVASAGNEGMGGCASVSDPLAIYAQVYSVGAITEGKQLAEFSSTGPVEVDGSGRTKPDIAAPGQDVLSAFPGDTYASLSGTSMAGPHLVGVVALMWSANPSLIGDIDRTEQILDQTAAPFTGQLPACVKPGSPNNAVGYGVVDAYAAVKAAMGK